MARGLARLVVGKISGPETPRQRRTQGPHFELAKRLKEKTLRSLSKTVVVLKDPKGVADVIQVFVNSKQELEVQLAKLKPILGSTSILWVTYPKGTSKIKSDVNRDVIREYAQTVGLEAVSIFSVDDDWSALRLKPL